MNEYGAARAGVPPVSSYASPEGVHFFNQPTASPNRARMPYNPAAAGWGNMGGIAARGWGGAASRYPMPVPPPPPPMSLGLMPPPPPPPAPKMDLSSLLAPPAPPPPPPV